MGSLLPACILNRAWVGHSDYGGYYHQPTYSRKKGAWATRPDVDGYWGNVWASRWTLVRHGYASIPALSAPLIGSIGQLATLRYGLTPALVRAGSMTPDM